MSRTYHMLMGLASLSAIAALSGCGDDDAEAPPVVTPAPAPAPTPTPTPTPTSFNVQRCLDQTVGAGGPTVASLVVPDTLTLNLATTSGFPNGRKLTDPVIDVTLAVIFLDLTKHSPLALANLPLNPAANDVAFQSAFPYLAAPQGSPPLSGVSGTSFDFRSDPASAYVRVDRMGMPAVATALIASSRKTAYNDANPSDDAAGTFVPDLKGQLTTLTNALADDLVGAGLTPCATPG